MGRLRNHRPDLNGVFALDKALGASSAQACSRLRRLSGGAKVGHAGTLDPLATGVLVVCFGAATKSIATIQATEKRYTAGLDLEFFSATDDLEATPTPPPAGLPDVPPSAEQIRAVLDAMTGDVLQHPPAFSAVHVEGRRAYKDARAQLRESPTVDIGATRPPPRVVTIYSIEITGYEWPSLTLDVRTGKGVYIRSIARDLGAALGTGGRLTSLRRTAVGPYTEARAVRIEDLPDRFPADMLMPVLS